MTFRYRARNSWSCWFKVTASRYIRVAIREMLANSRKEPSLTLHLPNREPVSGVHFAFVSNSSPWTYANTRPVWTNPTTTFETATLLIDRQNTRSLAVAIRVGFVPHAEIDGSLYCKRSIRSP